MTQHRQAAEQLFAGDSEMAMLLRSQDWSQTPLGSIETWSQSLKTTLNILFNACCPMFLVWGYDRILFYNDACAALSEKNSHTLFGKTLNGSTDAAWSRICAEIEQVFATGRSVQHEHQPFLTNPDYPDNPTVAVRHTWCYSPLWNEVGQVGGVFATAYGVIQQDAAGDCDPVSDLNESKRAEDERKQAEFALREKEQQLQQLSDSMPQFVWICRATGELEYVNQQWSEFSGLTLEQTQDQTLMGQLYHPDDRQLAFEQWAIALDTQQAYEVEARLKRSSDGAYRWFLIRAVPGFNEQGQVRCWYGISTDIHERKRRALHDQFLNQLDIRLKQLSDVQALMWETVSSLGEYLELSRCTFVEIDWQRGLAIVERDWCQDVPSVAGTYALSDFITPEFQAAMAAGKAALVNDVTTDPRTATFASNYAVFQTRAFANAPCIYRGRWVADLTISSKTPRVWRDDEALLLQETIARIWPLIEQTKAMQALRESEKRLQMALEGSGGGLWHWNIVTDEAYRSPRWLEMLGYQEGDLPENSYVWESLIHPDDKAWVTERTHAHLQDDSVPYKFEYRLLSKSGEWKWIATYGKVVMRDERGNPLRMAGIHHDVTDRKITEIALQKSEERFRISQELSLDAFTILDCVRDQTRAIVDFAWRYVNPKAAEILQHSARELIGQRFLEVLPPNRFNDELFERYVRVVETGESHDIELSYNTDGGTGWFRNMAVKLEDGVAIFFSDITDRKRAEAEREQLLQDLANERTHFEAILRQMPAGVIIAEAPSGRLILGNQQAEQIWRHAFLRSTEIDEYREYKGFHANGRLYEPEEWPLARSLLKGEVVTQEEIQFLRGDGTTGVMEANSTPIYNQQGQIISGVVIFQDITDRKQIEEALRTSEERLRFAVEGAALGTWEYDLASSQIVWSERAKLMFDVSHDAEVDYEIFMHAIHPDDRDRIHAAVEQAIALREVYDVEMRSVWADNSIHWIRSIGRARYDHNGMPTRMIGIAFDITEHKQAEENLRESERRFRRLVESNMFGVAFGDFTGGIHYANDYFLNRLGYTREEIATGQLRWADITPVEFLPLDEKAMTELRIKGVSTPFEKEYIRKDKSRIPVLIGTALLQKLDDQQQEVIAFCIDLSEQKQAEAERERLLQQAQVAQEEAETANRIKDEFLAVLSHELRSPLNPILGWSRLLQTKQFNPQETRQALQTIERNAKLQTQLIEDLLDVSRILRGKMALNICPVNLVTVVESALETVRLAAEAKRIQIQTVITLDNTQTLGDATRLQQMIWNLLSNAVKFTPDGGQIEVRLEQVERSGIDKVEINKLKIDEIDEIEINEIDEIDEIEREERQEMRNVLSSSASYAQIQVKDTGKGINPDFLPYVFDYFRQEDSKTTRRFGGLGLGLAIVRHLTELHGGTIDAESAGEGQGATFVIRLPLITRRLVSGEKISTIRQSIDLSQLQILVVDDEQDMRDLVQTILAQQGAQVRVAASAVEALLMFEQQRPDILISDIGMPENDGYTLMQQIRNRSLEQGTITPAIALTAYAGEYDQQQAFRVGFQRHVAKPVEPEELIRAIADLAINR